MQTGSYYDGITQLEKAYDTIWKDGLIYKLYVSNFPLPLIKIIKFHINNRTLKDKIFDKFSTTITPLEGLPQRGLISPASFNIFINDIPKTNNRELALFADDKAIFSSSTKGNPSKCLKK